MFVHVEGPFVEEPFVPEERNDPPEIPAQGLPMEEFVIPVGVAETPGAPVNIVEENIVYCAQDQDTEGPEPESPPRIDVFHGRHVIKVMVPDQERHQGKTGNFSGVIPQEPKFFRILVNMMKHVVQPYGRNFRTDPGDDVGQNKIDDKRYQAFPGLRQRNQGPWLHAPHVGRHEQHNNHPFPPAEHPVNMAKPGNLGPPRRIQGDGGADELTVNQPPEGNDQNGIEEKGQYGTPENFRQAGLGLGEVTGANGPFAENDLAGRRQFVQIGLTQEVKAES